MTISKLITVAVAMTATALTLSASEPKEIFEKTCSKCHGLDGKGDTKMGKKLEIKDFTTAAFQGTFTDKQAASAIKEGIKDGDKIRMKAYDDLSDAEITGLVAYVRALKK